MRLNRSRLPFPLDPGSISPAYPNPPYSSQDYHSMVAAAAAEAEAAYVRSMDELARWKASIAASDSAGTVGGRGGGTVGHEYDFGYGRYIKCEFLSTDSVQYEQN